jgi:hypothetical protein
LTNPFSYSGGPIFLNNALSGVMSWKPYSGFLNTGFLAWKEWAGDKTTNMALILIDLLP